MGVKETCVFWGRVIFELDAVGDIFSYHVSFGNAVFDLFFLAQEK